MKTPRDLAAALLRKAESDLTGARLCLDNEVALDTACFHAQQCAEKALKAFLVLSGASYSLTHNLEKLIEQCAAIDPGFKTLLDDGAALTPFAVGLRYDDDFWPSIEDTVEAVQRAEKIREFVLGRNL